MDYEPGSCNIGRTEQKKRYLFGAVGMTAGLAYSAAQVVLNQPSEYILLSFLPFSLGYLGLIQGYSSFCSAYGFAGNKKIGSDLESVESPESLSLDRKKSSKIVAYSVGLGAVTAVLAFFTGRLI